MTLHPEYSCPRCGTQHGYATGHPPSDRLCDACLARGDNWSRTRKYARWDTNPASPAPTPPPETPHPTEISNRLTAALASILEASKPTPEPEPPPTPPIEIPPPDPLLSPDPPKPPGRTVSDLLASLFKK